MKDPIVKYNDEDFDEAEYLSIFEYLWYKGNPFTGTLLEEDNKSYTEYENGCAHGRCIEYFDNGQLAVDWIFNAGSIVAKKEWYRSGQLKKNNTLLYNEAGRLIRSDNAWLYPNGNKINEYKGDESLFFSPEGELAIKIVRNTDKNSQDTYIFYDKVLSECFEKLIYNYYPQESDFSHFNPGDYLWGWAVKKYSIDRANGSEIFDKLANCNDPRITNIASYLIEKLNKEEIIPDKYIEFQGYKVEIM